MSDLKVKINAHLDAAQFGRTMHELSLASHRSMKEVLQQQGKLAALEFVNIFPPMLTLSGKDSFGQQRQLGMAAVASDIRSAYATADEVYDSIESAHGEGTADGFWSQTRGRGFDLAKARSTMINYGAGKFSQAEIGPFTRDVYNRWRSKNTGRITVRKYIKQVVTDPAALKAFIKEMQRHVGYLKSGAYKAAWAAGFPINVPGWISALPGSGTGTADYTGPYKHVTLTNNVSYSESQNKGNRLLTAVLGNRTRAMRRMLDNEAFKAWGNAARRAA